MIDTKELRRLAQDATPGPWIAAGPSFGESLPKYLNEVVVDREGDEDDGYSICNTPIGLELSSDMAFIAAANPAAITELLDRLEAAERSDAESIAMYRKARDERDALLAAARHEADCVEAAMAEINSLRAKIEAMEKEREELHTLVAVVKKQAYSEYVLRVKKEEECTQLRVKVERMEQPEVGFRERCTPSSPTGYSNRFPLYALPGAKGEEK